MYDVSFMAEIKTFRLSILTLPLILKMSFWKLLFHISGVLQASEEVIKSKKLKKVFEIVLAFGNYMNNGNRSNASGFKISSLNKIIDTKSSADTKITLLHYLVDVVEKQFPELLELSSDLKSITKAGSVVWVW